MSNDLHDHYAFPENPVIEAVMRFGSVKRWHMLDTTRGQTLADHSGCVALLVYAICITAPAMYFGNSSEASLCALIHDVPEVFTGDPPTPTKRHLSGLKELEASVTPVEYRRQMPDEVALLIKLCDVADGLRFIRLHGVGTTAEHAMRGVEAQFRQLRDRAISWFPAEVASHVLKAVHFYAYETRVDVAQSSEAADAGPVADDLARRQGNITRGPRPELRDAPTFEEWKAGRARRYTHWNGNGPRNGLVGTEGSLRPAPENYGGSS